MSLFPITDRVENLFEAVLLLPENDRDAYLRAQCGSDTTLLAQVKSLVAASGHADNYFSQLSKKLGLQSVFAGDLELPQSKSIGPYRLIRLLGRGGMGAVYLAERSDEQFEKQVALKILPIGVGGEVAKQRFVAERQILARLVHPNIARLLDGGIAEQNTPYFVMDYVDGLPIDEYCDSLRLEIDARIELFLSVADAVEYAHRNLIVHRDIKPGNVLVEADGSAKLVDFGVAKLLEAGSGGEALTVAGQLPMTLLYSSPEALRGEPVTTAVDVYSLGVLLYQLLAGCYPREVDRLNATGAHHQLLGAIQRPASQALAETADSEANRLSSMRSTTPKSLKQLLSGDLDTILNKALAADAEQRYPTVEQLMADLHRYQQRLPILARAPSLTYRFSKYVGRRKSLVALTGLAALSLIAFGALAFRYTVDSHNQAVQIAAERDKAVSISDFLLATFSNADPTNSDENDLTARELLDRGAEQIDDELSDRPGVYATLSMAIGEAYSNLTLYDKARVQFEKAMNAYQRAGQQLTPTYADALYWLTNAHNRLGDYPTAEKLALRGIQLNENINNREGLANQLAELARIRQRTGNIDDIEPLYTRALSIRRELYGNQHTLVAESLHDLGSLLARQEKYERALNLHREGLSIRRAVFQTADIRLIESLYNLGAVSRQMERYEAAKAYFDEALAVLDEIHPEGSADEVFIYSGLAHVSRELGDLAQAIEYFKRGVDVTRRFFDNEHPNLGITLANLGHVLARTGECENAGPIIDEAAQIVFTRIPNHFSADSLRITQGVCKSAAGEYVEAEQLMLEGYNGQVQAFGADSINTHYAATELAKLYRAWGRPLDAERYEELAAMAE